LCSYVVTDIDECAGNPCQNGATCNNLQNQYTCTCAGGWQGTTCDVGKKYWLIIYSKKYTYTSASYKTFAHI